MRLIGLLSIAISTLALCSAPCRADAGLTASDLIESRNMEDLRAAGWSEQEKTDLSISQEAKAGKYSLKVTAQNDPGDYRGVELHRAIDLTGAQPRDRLVLNIKQNFGTGMVIQLWTEEGNVNRSFDLKQNEWTRVELDMDLKRWENPKGLTAWGKVNRIQFYAKNFNVAGQYLMLDGLSFTVDGKRIRPVESEQITDWSFPQQTDSTWRIGSDKAAWAISKATGQIIGGWNVQTKENYLLAVEGRYHLADRKSLVTGMERQDKVIETKFDAKNQRIELVCTNPTVPDLTITKKYWVDGDKLYQRTGFLTRSSDLQFVTYNSQAIFDKVYRDAGYYMGGGDGGWPLIPAPQLDGWRKVLEHQNTTKGMVLNQPDTQWSFAHIRTKLDDKFVWPWFTGAIAAYCEPENVLSYTPDGWDMSLGTSKLSQTKEVSYEEYFSIFKGDWLHFLTVDYPSLPDVQKAYAEIPPTPEWVEHVIVNSLNDIDRVKHIIETTDEGYVMVLVDFGGSWADYYVDQGLLEGWGGGEITGPEIREVIQKLKAISPRVKVGMYMWMLSTGDNTRIYKKHPNWFRSVNKDGELSSLFPGVTVNYAQLLSIPEAYDELVSQFDLVLNYLDTDFIYLDDPKAINNIDWVTGEYTRDDLSFQMFLDIKKIAAKYGPDKMVFFNNMCNPYADVNYIEARSKLDPEYWRFFAGNMTLVEANLSQKPMSRVALLYYVPPFEREYMNCILSMGWVPVLESSDVVERRPFLQAAFEVGNGKIVPVTYSPDWKTDKQTNIESHVIQRNDDSGYLLSFVSHDKQPVTVPVKLSLDTFKLDRDRPVYIWGYTVEDANVFRGTVSDKIAKAEYAHTGWQLDRAMKRRLLYAGPYQSTIDLPLAMEPFILNQLYISSQPIAVFSENHLPANYLFNNKPEVSITGYSIDMAGGLLEATVNSRRDTAELLACLPADEFSISELSVDGKAVPVQWAGEDGRAFPLIPIAKGEQKIKMVFSTGRQVSPAVQSATVALSADQQSIIIKGVEQALVTIAREGRTLFSRSVAGSVDGISLPIVSIRTTPGDYQVTVRPLSTGSDAQSNNALAQTTLHLEATPALAELKPPSPGLNPGKEAIMPVNRKINGVEVLQSAATTSNARKSSFQSDMDSLMAKVDPDQLLMEAGTTRKLDVYASGAAFAGLEFKDLRKFKAKLSNTFHNAPHVFGKGLHAPPWSIATSTFAGIVVDYHTPAGYTKRVRLAAGVMSPDCTSEQPLYGKSGVADQLLNLGTSLIETPESTITIDLQTYAPADWDGQVWLSAGSDWVAPNRRLTMQILETNDAVTGDFNTAIDPKAYAEAYNKPKSVTVPRSPGGILVDGMSNEEMWRGAGVAGEFFLVGGKGVSKAGTSAMLLYDDENLIVTFTCKEPSRKRPLIQGGAVWDDDEIEIWIDTDGDGKTYKQIIVTGANATGEYSESGPAKIGVKSAVYVEEGDYWSVEVFIPYKGLGVAPPKPGDQWRISLCRYRPAGKDFNAEAIVWAPLQGDSFKDLANFGTLIFK